MAASPYFVSLRAAPRSLRAAIACAIPSRPRPLVLPLLPRPLRPRTATALAHSIPLPLRFASAAAPLAATCPSRSALSARLAAAATCSGRRGPSILCLPHDSAYSSLATGPIHASFHQFLPALALPAATAARIPPSAPRPLRRASSLSLSSCSPPLCPPSSPPSSSAPSLSPSRPPCRPALSSSSSSSRAAPPCFRRLLPPARPPFFLSVCLPACCPLELLRVFTRRTRSTRTVLSVCLSVCLAGNR